MTDSEFIDFMKELILAPDSAIKKAHMERAVGIIAKKDAEIAKLQNEIRELQKEMQRREDYIEGCLV